MLASCPLQNVTHSSARAFFVCKCTSEACCPCPHTHDLFLPSVLVPWGQQEPSLLHSESWCLIFQVHYSVASSALVCLKNSRRQMETVLQNILSQSLLRRGLIFSWFCCFLIDSPLHRVLLPALTQAFSFWSTSIFVASWKTGCVSPVPLRLGHPTYSAAFQSTAESSAWSLNIFSTATHPAGFVCH